MNRFKHTLLVALAFAAVISLSACKNAIPSLPEELPTGTITGKAVYQNAAESSGITITLEKTDGLRSMSVVRSIELGVFDSSARSVAGNSTTDREGNYIFTNVEEGVYTIYASSKDSTEKAVTTNVVVEKNANVTAEDLKLTATGNISGKITLNNSETESYGFLTYVAGTSYSAMTDRTGAFTISGIPAGTGYSLIVTKQQLTYIFEESVTVTAKETVTVPAKNFTTSEITAGYTNGKDGTSISWLGSFASPEEIENPKYLDAYFNTADGCSYIYDGENWTLLATKGEKGENGTSTNGNDGISIKWLGSFASAEEIENPEKLNAFYNTTNGCSYIYDGEKWTLLASKGENGDDLSIDTSKFITEDQLDEKINSTNKDYKIKYHLNGGYIEIGAPYEFNEGEFIKKLPDAYKPGVLFKGWFDNEELEGTPVTQVLQSSDVELWASFGNKVYISELDNYLNIYDQYLFSSTAISLVILDEIPDFSTLRQILGSYKSLSLELSFDSDIKIIPKSAFYGLENLSAITIPDSVTSIGEGTFSGCSKLAKITIPDSVTSIGEGAFSGCSKLANITIPNSVTSIGDCTFKDCTSLVSITIPNSVTSIGGTLDFEGMLFSILNDFDINENNLSSEIKSQIDKIGAFSGCSSLASVIIPESVTSIGCCTFYGCSSLTNITIPETVTYIGSYAFFNCSSLKNVAIPESVTYIESGTFHDCNSLESITLPNSIIYIGRRKKPFNFPNSVFIESVFAGCSSLADIVIPEKVQTIENYTFAGCSSLTSITIPRSITSIGEEVFRGCSNLINITVDEYNTKYDSRGNSNAIIMKETNELIVGCSNTKIPDSVILIGDSAFYGCRSLTSVTIPSSVTSIGDEVFRDCTGLTNITIPDSVISIGKNAFSNCSSLTSVTIPNSIKYLGAKVFDCCAELRVTISAQTLGRIGSQDFGTMIDVILLDTDIISDYEFRNYKNLNSITIPDSVTSIGNGAFYGCRDLKSITISDSVTIIGNEAFRDCTSLTSITIPDSVTSIGNGAFYGCWDLKSITIPDSVTIIGNEAFANCNSLTSIAIPDSITSIGNSAFYDCWDLKSITIPDSVTSIGNEAFANCNSLTSIAIPDSVTTIKYRVFCGCYNLTSITIPNSVTTIGNEAFAGCNSLTSITIPNSVTTIGNGAFADCSSLTSIAIPDSVTSIGDYLFYYCSSLTDITIPDSVTSIGNEAFYGCSSLTDITIPDSVTSIRSGAFYDCNNLKNINYKGTEAQWNEIYGYGIPSGVTIIYNYIE